MLAEQEIRREKKTDKNLKDTVIAVTRELDSDNDKLGQYTRYGRSCYSPDTFL